VEVKCRKSLAIAALALGTRQQNRLFAAAECLLAANPDWARADTRFDVIMVDQAGCIRRIADAFRLAG
jgi:putative endonuclease